MEQKERIILLILVLGCLAAYSIGYVLGYASQQGSHIDVRTDSTSLRQLNIVCTKNHDHPLLQGYEYCVYDSRVREYYKLNH